jgi:hypothetical protein
MILFWPLAIAAVLAANRAARAHGAGDATTAHREAARARTHARQGVLVGAIWTTLALALEITLVVLGVQHGPGLLERVGAGDDQVVAAPEQYRTAAAPPRDAISLDPFDLQAGDCFVVPDWETDWPDIDVIPCSRPHNGLVIATTEHPQDEFPGTTALSDEAWYDCWSRYTSYSGTDGTEDSPVWVLQPTADDWRTGERTSVCFIEAPDLVRGEFSQYPEIFEPGGAA